MYTTLITVEQLHTLMHDQANSYLIFDCSFDLMQPAWGQTQYQQAHIPHAIYADLNTQLSAHCANYANANANAIGLAYGAPASGGRHPLPQKADIAAWLNQIGFNNSMQAIVYDRNQVNYCGRLWWMMKWLGHEAVAVLDGGFQAWQAFQEKNPTQLTPPKVPKTQKNQTTSDFQIRPSRYALTDAAQVLAKLGHPSQTIIDARGQARFKGEVEPIDPIAGHIPGALNRPFTCNLDATGHFKPALVLRQEFDDLLAGKDPAGVVHQCGSGVSAIPNLLAMEIAGFTPSTLYAGSWSDWCAQPNAPIAQG